MARSVPARAERRLGPRSDRAAARRARDAAGARLRSDGSGRRGHAGACGRDRARGARARRAAERRVRGDGGGERAPLRPGRRRRAAAARARLHPGGAEPLRRRLLGHDPGAPGAGVELLGRARREPDPPPPRLPAGNAPRDAAVPPRVKSGPRVLRSALRHSPLLWARGRARRAAALRGRRAARRRRRCGPEPARLLASDLRGERPAVRGDAAGGGAGRARRARCRGGSAARPGVRDQAARLAVCAVPARGARRRPLVQGLDHSCDLAAPRHSARRGRPGLPARRAARSAPRPARVLGGRLRLQRGPAGW